MRFAHLVEPLAKIYAKKADGSLRENRADH